MEKNRMVNAGNDILFKPELNVLSEVPYIEALETARQIVNDSISQRSIDDIPENEMKAMIYKTIEKEKITSSLTADPEEFINHIYHDMAGLSFISREGLFDQDGFEEININRWNDIEIITRGERKKTTYSFLSPQQGEDILLRIFRKTRTSFDETTPEATTDLGNGIRITALRSPIIDKDVGISASIRKVDSKVINKEEILARGTLTAEMQKFLELCLKYGISMCISGETGAGKTTLASSLLFEAARKLRVYTIEEGAREWDFRQYDENGVICNSVVHTKTRLSDELTLNIDQEKLSKLALRFDADIVAPSEIRGKEAFEVMSAANTGHTVCTTVHSNGTADTPGRIVELAKKAYDMSDNTLYTMCARAFPLLVHLKKGADTGRRVTEVREFVGYQNGEIQSQMLYEFITEDNVEQEDGSIKVIGAFRRVHPISQQFANKLLDKGASKAMVAPFLKQVIEHD